MWCQHEHSLSSAYDRRSDMVLGGVARRRVLLATSSSASSTHAFLTRRPWASNGHGFPTIRYFFMHNSLHTAPRRAQTWPTDPLDGWYSLKLNSTSFRCTRYPSRAPRAPSHIGHDSTLSKGRRASTATAAPGIGAPLRLLQNL